MVIDSELVSMEVLSKEALSESSLADTIRSQAPIEEEEVVEAAAAAAAAASESMSKAAPNAPFSLNSVGQNHITSQWQLITRLCLAN